MHEISRETFSQILNAFVNKENITARCAAKIIGCSEPTLKRLIAQESKPSDVMMKQAGIMISLGAKKYSKLSKAEKEKISEVIGSAGGGILGFGSISAAISAAGGGLSAAGITSGLATIGGAVAGGGMLAGIIVTAGIPIAATGIGYGIIKGIKFFVNKSKLNKIEHDLKWEAAS